MVDNGLNIGGEKVSELLSSDSSFEGDIDDIMKRQNTMFLIKDGKR